MPISVTCAECEKKLKVADTAAGKKIRCPACKAIVDVPTPLEVADEEEAITETPPKKKSAPARKQRDDDEEYEEERRPKARKRRDEEDDDEEEEEERRPRKKKRKGGKPHRGSNILLFGIGSLLIGCIPFAAWYLGWQAIHMANEDLDQMSAGRMDDSGQGSTQIGKICGIVGCVLGILWLILGITLRVMGG